MPFENARWSKYAPGTSMLPVWYGKLHLQNCPMRQSMRSPRRSQDYAEKTETIVVHLPTGKRDGHSFSELRLETLAHDGLATSALGPLYTGQNERPAWIQAPLFEYPLFCPRVAFRMSDPVPWFIAETAAKCLSSGKQDKPSHVPSHARSTVQLRKQSVDQKCSPVIGWTANDRVIG